MMKGAKRALSGREARSEYVNVRVQRVIVGYFREGRMGGLLVLGGERVDHRSSRLVGLARRGHGVISRASLIAEEDDVAPVKRRHLVRLRQLPGQICAEEPGPGHRAIDAFRGAPAGYPLEEAVS